MRVILVLIAFAGILAGSFSLSARQAVERQRASAADPAGSVNLEQVVETYCAGCHNGTMKSPSGSLMDQFDADGVFANPDVWTRAYRQLQAGTMPPVGAPRPDRAAYEAALRGIEQALGADTKSPAAVDSQQISSRLANLLWNSTPDAALVQEAREDRLRDPAEIERQVRRMLGDERAQSFVSSFFVPWLGLNKLSTADPDKRFFPDYEVSLRDALVRETELFLLSQLREDRDPIELWTANYTFLNEQLARHYEIPGVNGSEFRRVALSKPERSGLLGQGSVLMVTSRHQHGVDAAYTSPAARSVWVQQHFLGAPTPRPFPGAQPVKPEFPITPQTRVLPAVPCVTCHRNFFPLGYALENFDPIGRWRTRDQMGPVDASGALVDGTPFNGVVELRQGLLKRPDAFRTTITEQLILYASTGSPNVNQVTPDTLIEARQILRGMKEVRWSAIIAGVVARMDQ